MDTENTWFDYQVSGEEGDDNLTVKFQFKNGWEEGDAFSVDEPGKVVFDGQQLTADSAKMTGVFYEINKPIDSFSGKHSVVFTDFNKSDFKEEFEFKRLTLVSELPDTIHRNELVFEFNGLENEDYVRVVLTDTSFANDGINRLDTVLNSQIIISKIELNNLANGPIQLEFIREYERPILKRKEESGRLAITYKLKRQFILAD